MSRLGSMLFGLLLSAACTEPSPPGAPSSAGGSGPGGSGPGGSVGDYPGSGRGGGLAGDDAGSGGGGAAGGYAGSGAGGGLVGGNAGLGQGGAGEAGGAGKLSECELRFPYRDELGRGFWLGADSNFSVVLSPTLALMTFQDTFVGGVSDAARSGSQMVGNSVARIGCDHGAAAIDYHWGGAAGDHRALFDEQAPSGARLWVQRPWLHDGKLFLTATRVTSDAQGFSEQGMTLARVDNPLAAPEAWHIEYFDLTDQRLTVGKGVVVASEHVYLFTPYQANMILARIAKPRLLEASISESSLEYLKSDGSWAPGLVAASAKQLGLPANTGLSVRYHAASRRYLALFTDTSGWPSASIALSSAEALEGPWTKPTQVYSVPEMDPQAAGYDPDTICYGAAEHEAWNTDPDGELLFTYTCNSNEFAKLLANMAIYVPRVVTLKNPLAVLP